MKANKNCQILGYVQNMNTRKQVSRKVNLVQFSPSCHQGASTYVTIWLDVAGDGGTAKLPGALD